MMKARSNQTEFQRIHPVRIMPPAYEVLKKRMDDAVASRAFRLYMNRDRTSGSDAEDWRQAEADVVRPLQCGSIVEDDTVCLTADISCFGPGTVEVWVEPHRITLCGACPEKELEGPAQAATSIGPKNWIFRTYGVTAELDPAEVIVRFNGPAMYVFIHRARPMPQQAVEVHAA
jgi:Protein of unknown function (DUF2934)